MTQHNPNQDDELQILEQRVRKAIENNNRDEAMLLLKQAREAYDRVRRAMGEITTSELNSSYVEVFEKLRDYKKREGVHSEIDVPMVQGDKVIGVLHLNYDTPRQFTDNEFDTIESLAKQAVNALSLPEKINGESLAFNSLTLTGNDSEILTPNFLATKLSPYLNALSEIQNIISDVLKQKHHEIRIRMIAQNSPISVSLDGAAEAVQAVRDTVIPWRRKHAETMAHLLEQEKIAEIELKKAEVLEKRAIAAKEREFTDKLKVENEKLRAETSLQQAKVQLATEIIMSISTSLNETEKEMYIAKLLPTLDILALGRLEMVVDK